MPSHPRLRLVCYCLALQRRCERCELSRCPVGVFYRLVCMLVLGNCRSKAWKVQLDAKNRAQNAKRVSISNGGLTGDVVQP
eukprot:5613168-Prymnesium_polylepis.1